MRSPEANRPSVTITNYAETNPAEYMAEGFKYAITDPESLKDKDPALYKVMTKYFIKKTPAKDVNRDVITDEFTERMRGVSTGRIDPYN